jgi:phage terminase large subunit-like protein
MLSEKADGRWAASTALLVMPRQNGKNSVLEAVELAGLFLFGDRRIIHTAHLATTAADHMRRMVALITQSPELEAVCQFYFANGKEAIVRSDTGARLEFITRGRKTIRGGSPERVIFDEALYLTDEQIQAIIPSMSAQSMNAEGSPQMIYTSSAPLPESDVLHRVRDACIAGSLQNAFYAEWGCEPGADPTDRNNWYQSNPGMGIRISEDWVAENELPIMSPEAFAIERLGVVNSSQLVSKVLGWDDWLAAIDKDSSVVSGHASLAVGPGMSYAALGYAGVRADGLLHVEVARHEPGTAWVVEAAQNAVADTGRPLVVDPKSPTSGLVSRLREAGVPLLELSSTDFVQSCAALQADVLNGRVRHRDQPALNASVTGADIRPVGEAWAFSARVSTVDITPLLAVTLAAVPCRNPVAASHAGFVDLNDFMDE